MSAERAGNANACASLIKLLAGGAPGGRCAIPALGGGAFTATAGRCVITSVACGAIAETVGRCSITIAGCVAITATGSRCSIPTAAAAPFPAAFHAPPAGAAAAPLPDAAPSPQLRSFRAAATLVTAVAAFPAAATLALLTSGGPMRAPRLPSFKSAYLSQQHVSRLYLHLLRTLTLFGALPPADMNKTSGTTGHHHTASTSWGQTATQTIIIINMRLLILMLLCHRPRII